LKSSHLCIFAPRNNGCRIYKLLKTNDQIKLASMKRVLCAVVLLTGFVLNGMSQPKGMGKNDPEAKKVLDAVSAKFKTFKSAKADFTFKVENSAGKVQSSRKGSLSMKGTKYRVTITGQEIFCDGSNVWTYDKAANEVTITKFDPSTSTLTPQKIFTNFYDKDFLYKLNGEKKEGSKSKNFHKVYVYIDKDAKTVNATRVLEKSGNRFTYTVNSFTPNAAATDAQFVFDAKKFPGVEVVDLR
jgi:outer membrane lipoprotein carrier protein